MGCPNERWCVSGTRSDTVVPEKGALRWMRRVVRVAAKRAPSNETTWSGSCMRKRESQRQGAWSLGLDHLPPREDRAWQYMWEKCQNRGVGLWDKANGLVIVVVTMISMSGGCCHHHTYTYTHTHTQTYRHTTSPVRAYSEHFGLRWMGIERILVTVVSMTPIDPILLLQLLPFISLPHHNNNITI